MLSRGVVLLTVLLVGVCTGITKKRFRDALGIKKLPKVSVFRQKVQLLDHHIHGDDGMRTGEDDDDDFDWSMECGGIFEIYQHMNTSGCLDDGTPLGDNFTEADAAVMDIETFCYNCNATNILDMVHDLDDSCYNHSEVLYGLSMILPIFGAMCTQNSDNEFCVADFFLEMWLDDDEDEYHGMDSSYEDYGLAYNETCSVSDQDCAEGLFCSHIENDIGNCDSCDSVNCNATTEDRGPCCTCHDDFYGYLENDPEKNCSIAASNETDWSCESYENRFSMYVYEICPASCQWEECSGEDSDSYSSYNMSYSDSHSYDTSSDSNSSDEDDDDMYWWDLLCAADDDCPWEQRLVDHQFDCNTDLFIFTTLCVQDQDRYCVNTVVDFLESGYGYRMPTQYDHEHFCSDPCTGAVIDDMYANELHAPECINDDEIPIDLSFACYQHNGTYCLPQLYGGMDGEHPELNCTLGNPENIENWTCDDTCVLSIEDMYEEYGCCADIFFEVEFGYMYASNVSQWIETECGVSPPPGDNCSEYYMPPLDTPECKELREYDVDVLDALKCLVDFHEPF